MGGLLGGYGGYKYGLSQTKRKSMIYLKKKKSL